MSQTRVNLKFRRKVPKLTPPLPEVLLWTSRVQRDPPLTGFILTTGPTDWGLRQERWIRTVIQISGLIRQNLNVTSGQEWHKSVLLPVYRVPFGVIGNSPWITCTGLSVFRIDSRLCIYTYVCVYINPSIRDWRIYVKSVMLSLTMRVWWYPLKT